MKDPKRLTADDELAELAPDLLAAVRALREELPDPAVVARSLRALETLPPPTSRTSKLGFNILAGLSAVVVATIAVVFLTQTPERQPDPTPAAITRSAPAIDPSPAPTAPTDPPEHLQNQEAPAPAAQVEPPPPSRPARRSVGVKNKLPPANSASAAPPPIAAAPAESESVTKLEARARPETPEAALTPAAGPARVPDAVSEPRGPEPTDEAGLLFRAKRLATRDPAGALRLLDSHAFYFPNGAFVEEREILAIDLLSRIGQRDRARERAVRFRVRFPKSVYRSADFP